MPRSIFYFDIRPVLLHLHRIHINVHCAWMQIEAKIVHYSLKYVYIHAYEIECLYMSFHEFSMALPGSDLDLMIHQISKQGLFLIRCLWDSQENNFQFSSSSVSMQTEITSSISCRTMFGENFNKKKSVFDRQVVKFSWFNHTLSCSHCPLLTMTTPSRAHSSQIDPLPAISVSFQSSLAAGNRRQRCQPLSTMSCSMTSYRTNNS